MAKDVHNSIIHNSQKSQTHEYQPKLLSLNKLLYLYKEKLEVNEKQR